MTESKRSKAFLIAISILIAFGFWLYVDGAKGIKVTTYAYDIPVEFIGEDTTLADRGLMLIPDDSNPTVTLRLRGERTTIAKLDTSKIRIQVDLSSITSVGKQSLGYRIIYPNGISSTQVTVEYASTTSITVNIGELYKKSIEIRCEITGNLPDGYLAGEVTFSPETLEIRGQQADIERVSYAKVTLNIDDATENVVENLPFELYDYNDELVEDDDIHAMSDTIQVTMPVQIIKELPLNVSFEESPGSSSNNINYSIEPESITVSGDPAILESVDSLLLGSISLADLDSSATYHYTITLPEGCTNLSGVTTAKVYVAFKDISSVQLTTTNIGVENGPEDCVPEILTGEVTVTLRGTSTDLASITPDDVRVVGDLTNVSSADGSYTVPATVYVDTNRDVGVIGTYQIQVTISRNESSDSSENTE